jgi:hypothetical protein
MSEVLLAAARDRGASHIASTLGRVLDIAQSGPAPGLGDHRHRHAPFDSSPVRHRSALEVQCATRTAGARQVQDPTQEEHMSIIVTLIIGGIVGCLLMTWQDFRAGSYDVYGQWWNAAKRHPIRRHIHRR